LWLQRFDLEFASAAAIFSDSGVTAALTLGIDGNSEKAFGVVHRAKQQFPVIYGADHSGVAILCHLGRKFGAQGEAQSMILRSNMLRLVGIAIAALLFVIPGSASRADPSPFDTLLGSWGGSGEMRLDKGRTERIKCSAYYTGGGAELGLAIRCQSDSYKIEIRSKLSYSGGRLSGNWEERTFNASGTASGTASPSRISLAIKGGVSGTMLVNFTKSSQSVSISTQGIALQGVRISLARS